MVCMVLAIPIEPGVNAFIRRVNLPIGVHGP